MYLISNIPHTLKTHIKKTLKRIINNNYITQNQLFKILLKTILTTRFIR